MNAHLFFFVFLIQNFDGLFIIGTTKIMVCPSSTVCWSIVGSLWKPSGNDRIGNDSVGKWLGNGRCRGPFNIERVRAGF